MAGGRAGSGGAPAAPGARARRPDPDQRVAGILHYPVRAPRLLAKNAAFEIWELRFRGRNGGGLVAVYDRTRDRHRWVWGTHGDQAGGQPLGAAPFRVVRFDGKQLVIRTEFEGATRRVEIALPSGVIREDR